MLGKDSVLKWFKELSSHTRIELMCSLLNKCLPFELRFMGTCLEDLGRQDFTQMKDFEVKANNVAELAEFQVQCIISDTRTRQKLALYVCLLHSLNTPCSTLIYKSLYGIDINDVVSAAKNSDEKILEELLTIYTVAVNHPAFSFEQRSNLGSILLRLSQEDNRIKTEKLSEAVSADYAQAQPVSDGIDVHRQDMLPPNVPSGLGFPPGLGSTGNFIQPYPVYSTFPLHQQIVWQQVNYQPIPADSLPAAEMTIPFTGSPLMSRHSSPSQSAQHSRANSPARKPYFSRADRELQPKNRPPFTESSFVNPPHGAKPFLDTVDAPNKDGHLGQDNEISDISEWMGELSTEEMLRTAVVSLNGLAGPSSRAPPPRQSHPAPPPFDPEMTLPGPGHFVRPMEPTAMTGGLPGPIPPSRTPVTSASSRLNHPSVSKNNSHGLEDGRNCSSGSGSDASSTSHSPPVTPAIVQQNTDRGYDHEETMAKPRTGMGRGRGRTYGPQGVQTLPRERGAIGGVARRDGPRSAPPTPHEEKKTYLMAPSGEMVAPTPLTNPLPPRDIISAGMSFTPFIQGPFTTGPPLFPQYPPTFVRPPYSFPNGDVLYTYQPPAPAPFLPSTLVTYSSSVPPPKIACYNCSSQTHHPNDCKEPTMEEYSSKGQYRIDYGKSNELLSSEK